MKLAIDLLKSTKFNVFMDCLYINTFLTPHPVDKRSNDYPPSTKMYRIHIFMQYFQTNSSLILPNNMHHIIYMNGPISSTDLYYFRRDFSLHFTNSKVVLTYIIYGKTFHLKNHSIQMHPSQNQASMPCYILY